MPDNAYFFLKLLGSGATSQVYLVREQGTNLLYACKKSSHVPWLRAESDLLRRVSHPLFPAWKDYYETEGEACLVMEYLEGKSLRQLLAEGERPQEREALALLRSLAEGLSYLHARKPPLVYKDLKPSNIMIGPDGEVRLLDLGAAALRRGWKIGTPGYSAPELLSGTGEPGPENDVYSLGVLGKELLVPGEGMGTPPYLADLLERCVQPDPRQRPPDALAFLRALDRYSRAAPPGRILLSLQVIFSRKRNKQVFFEKNIYKNGCETDFFA